MTNDPYYEWHLHNLNGYAAYPTARDQQRTNQISRHFRLVDLRRQPSAVGLGRRRDDRRPRAEPPSRARPQHARSTRRDDTSGSIREDVPA